MCTTSTSYVMYVHAYIMHLPTYLHVEYLLYIYIDAGLST